MRILHVCTIDTLISKIGTLNFIPYFNTNNETECQLSELFNTLAFSLSNVFINWYRFDDIDKMSLKDLDQYFYDIWFPATDDIDIFDDTFKWIVSIFHDGIISCIFGTIVYVLGLGWQHTAPLVEEHRKASGRLYTVIMAASLQVMRFVIKSMG